MHFNQRSITYHSLQLIDVAFSESDNKTRLPSNLRPATRECVHLVTVRVFTSGHVTKMAVTLFDQ